MMNLQDTTLTKSDRNIVVCIIFAILFIFGCLSCTTETKKGGDLTKIKLDEKDFAAHFMIGLDTMDLIFDEKFTPNFRLVGKKRDWENLETTTGQDVLSLTNKIYENGKSLPLIYQFQKGIDSIKNDMAYPCGCSKGYLWKNYVLIYCEIKISEREKFSQNFLFKDGELIFQDGSGMLIVR